MKNYEFKVETIRGSFLGKSEKIDKNLNEKAGELYAEGWELLSCAPISNGEVFFATFKREIQK